MALTLRQLASGMFSRVLLNSNFEKIENKVNDDLVHRQNGSAQMQQDLDMNGNNILNLGDPIASLGVATKNYVDTQDNAFEALSQGRDNLLQSNIDASLLVIENVESGYQAGDANLQAQLTGNIPLEASAFSPVSWHDQSIDNSVTIPDNKNAWSFGPTVTISAGQSVTIGDGSYWTIANGEQQ
jgi:hypothetical protein